MSTEVEMTPEARHMVSEDICGFLNSHPGEWTPGEIKGYTMIEAPTSTVIELLDELKQNGIIKPGVPVRVDPYVVEKTYQSDWMKAPHGAVWANRARKMLDLISGRTETQIHIPRGLEPLKAVRVYYTSRRTPSGWYHCRYFIVNGHGQMENITQELSEMFGYRVTSSYHPVIRIQAGGGTYPEDVVHELKRWLHTFPIYANAFVIPEDIECL